MPPRRMPRHVVLIEDDESDSGSDAHHTPPDQIMGEIVGESEPEEEDDSAPPARAESFSSAHSDDEPDEHATDRLLRNYVIRDDEDVDSDEDDVANAGSEDDDEPAEPELDLPPAPVPAPPQEPVEPIVLDVNTVIPMNEELIGLATTGQVSDIDHYDAQVDTNSIFSLAYTEISMVSYAKGLPKPPQDYCMVPDKPIYMCIRVSEVENLRRTLLTIFPDRGYLVPPRNMRQLLYKARRISMSEFQIALKIAGIRKVRITNYGMKSGILSYAWLESLCNKIVVDVGTYWKTPGFFLGFQQKLGEEDPKTKMHPSLDFLFMRANLLDFNSNEKNRPTITFQKKFTAEEAEHMPFKIKKIIVYPKIVHYAKYTRDWSVVQVPLHYRGTRRKINMWLGLLQEMENQVNLNLFCGSRIEVRGTVSSMEEAENMLQYAQGLVMTKFQAFLIPVSMYIECARVLIGRATSESLQVGTDTRLTPPQVRKMMAFLGFRVSKRRE